MKTKVDKRYMCSRGSIWALTKSGELGVLLFLLKISLTVFFCINSRGLMSDLLVFPHRVIPALKYAVLEIPGFLSVAADSKCFGPIQLAKMCLESAQLRRFILPVRYPLPF